jgi:hypothetical protein
VAWLTSLWLCFLYFRNRLDTIRPTGGVLALLLIAALLLDPGLRQTTLASLDSDSSPAVLSLSAIDWERLKLNQSALQNADVAATAGKNLVMVFMEGLGKIYTDNAVFPGLTPNLNRFAEEGWALDNLNQVRGSEWTMGGIVSSLCGTPLVHNLGLDGNAILFTGFLDRAWCLPDVLDKADYEQVFMGGASLDFAGKGEFLRAHSFDQVLGREELAPRLPDPSYLGGWGLFDDSLFSLAIDEFNRLAETGRPFNLTVLTVDTHHPTGEPSHGCKPFEAIDNSILHAVHCTDQLVGKFVEQLKQHAAYEETIVVLVSDHLGMRNNAQPLFPRNYERTLYFTALNTPPHDQAQDQATPVDLAPTILNLLGVGHNVTFLAGIDLLEEGIDSPYDPSESGARREALRFINSNHLSSRSNNLLYSLNQSRVADLDFSEHVQDARLSRRGLAFTSTGRDPYFILPELTIDTPEDTRLYITVESEQASTITLYYSSLENSDYSEEQTISFGTQSGETHIVFRLDDVARTGRLRIDPGASSGRFLISRLEIRSR